MFYAGGFDCGTSLVDAGFDLGDAVSFIEDFGFPWASRCWLGVVGTRLGCCAANGLRVLIVESAELGDVPRSL